jgi:hypothetical protein
MTTAFRVRRLVTVLVILTAVPDTSSDKADSAGRSAGQQVRFHQIFISADWRGLAGPVVVGREGSRGRRGFSVSGAASLVGWLRPQHTASPLVTNRAGVAPFQGSQRGEAELRAIGKQCAGTGDAVRLYQLGSAALSHGGAVGGKVAQGCFHRATTTQPGRHEVRCSHVSRAADPSREHVVFSRAPLRCILKRVALGSVACVGLPGDGPSGGGAEKVGRRGGALQEGCRLRR